MMARASLWSMAVSWGLSLGNGHFWLQFHNLNIGIVYISVRQIDRFVYLFFSEAKCFYILSKGQSSVTWISILNKSILSKPAHAWGMHDPLLALLFSSCSSSANLARLIILTYQNQIKTITYFHWLPSKDHWHSKTLQIETLWNS